MGKTYCHVDDTERRLVKQMAKEGVPWTTTQKVIGRSADTINATLHKEAIQHNDARVRSSAEDAKKVLAVAEKMVKKAYAQEEVTLAMILEKPGYEISPSIVRKHCKTMKVSL